MKKIEIFDTTLRDGTQGEGVNLSLDDKLFIAKKLDWFGVDYIEGGWPGSNPKDESFFEAAKDLELENAKIVAFGSTRHAKSLPSEDANLNKLINSGSDVVIIFGKTWDFHVKEALRVPLETNLEMIKDSIEYVKEQTGKPVFYDAEHFFDGYKANPEYAMKTLEAAKEAGAERIVLCETNGGALPSDITKAIEAIFERLGKDVVLGIHAHNDGGLAVANTLVAVEAGCVQVQGTINGFGERCGNTDLCVAIPNLITKLGYEALKEGSLQKITEMSKTIWERSNNHPLSNQPFVGKSAFAHKGGIHVSAVQRNSKTYEHIEPEVVGNIRRVLISELSGRSNVNAKLSNRYPELTDPKVIAKVLDDVQNRENRGYSYEAAEASFELLVKKHIGAWSDNFDLDYFRVHSIGSGNDSDHLVEATCKLKVKDDIRLCVSEGNGPVDALSRVLTEALLPSYPIISQLDLRDYKVRVVNSQDGTAAKVRVLIEFKIKGKRFSTIGVSENIIKASWNALVDAMDFVILESK